MYSCSQLYNKLWKMKQYFMYTFIMIFLVLAYTLSIGVPTGLLILEKNPISTVIRVQCLWGTKKDDFEHICNLRSFGNFWQFWWFCDMKSEFDFQKHNHIYIFLNEIINCRSLCAAGFANWCDIGHARHLSLTRC